MKDLSLQICKIMHEVEARLFYFVVDHRFR